MFSSRALTSITAVNATDWNALVGDDFPYLRHEFLLALEQGACIGEHSGWLPNYFILEDAQQKLIAAAPLFRKYNSFGEFVFDWAWADAYERAGFQYYPKLVVAPPFTPATGPRLLTTDPHNTQLKHQLLDALLDYATECEVSSLHLLYPNDQLLTEHPALLKRYGYEFHWHNQNYNCFDDFLATLSSKRRKQIKKERRSIVESGLEIQTLPGDQVSDQQWQVFYQLYQHTFLRYGNYPILSEQFFRQIAASMGSQIVLVIALQDHKIIAASYFLRGTQTIYGRYWGAFEDIPYLHFELCYYQGQDYCIEQGLQRFEPGAQGEHKISRGFIPTETSSYHWIAHLGFRHAIQRHLKQENPQVIKYKEELSSHSPYKSSCNTGW